MGVLQDLLLHGLGGYCRVLLTGYYWILLDFAAGIYVAQWAARPSPMVVAVPSARMLSRTVTALREWAVAHVLACSASWHEYGPGQTWAGAGMEAWAWAGTGDWG